MESAVRNKRTLIIGINLSDGGSTGGDMLYSLEFANRHGFDVLAIVPRASVKEPGIPVVSFGLKLSFFSRLGYKIGRIFHLVPHADGYYYRENSSKIIRIIKSKKRFFSNIIICVHNIHDCCVDFVPLMNFLGKCDHEVVIALHDSWLLGGGCYYSSFVGCQKWRNKCVRCPLKIPGSAKTLRRRTKVINRIKKLTWAPVSQWLANELKKSHLRDAPTYIIPAETSIAPLSGVNPVRQRLGISANRKIVLAVSAYWNDWKGDAYLYQIADRLPDDYVLLVVGGSFDAKGRNNIIHVGSVNRNAELPYFYQAADVFVSVTQAEAFGLVLVEAQACGTPVVGFGHGGSVETITEKSGIMVGTDNDVDKLVNAIVCVAETKPFRKADIINSGRRFVKYQSSEKWLELFKKLAETSR